MWAIDEKFHEGGKFELGPECWIRLREWWSRHTKVGAVWYVLETVRRPLWLKQRIVENS